MFVWVQSTDYSGFIRREFSDEGLAGKIRMLPLEKHFRLDNVKSVSPHAPSLCAEAGLEPSRTSMTLHCMFAVNTRRVCASYA